MKSKAEEILHRLGYSGMMQTGLYFPEFAQGEYPPPISGNTADPTHWPQERVIECDHQHVSRGICMNPKCNKKIDPFTGKAE